MKTLIACLLLAAAGCALPLRAAVRLQAGQQLESCLGWRVRNYPGPSQKARCMAESAAFCQERGLEAGCGTDELWGRNYREMP